MADPKNGNTQVLQLHPMNLKDIYNIHFCGQIATIQWNYPQPKTASHELVPCQPSTYLDKCMPEKREKPRKTSPSSLQMIKPANFSEWYVLMNYRGNIRANHFTFKSIHPSSPAINLDFSTITRHFTKEGVTESFHAILEFYRAIKNIKMRTSLRIHLKFD